MERISKTMIAGGSIALVLLCSMLFATRALAASAPDNLPQPDPTFYGKISETYHDSTARETYRKHGEATAPRAIHRYPNLFRQRRNSVKTNRRIPAIQETRGG